MYNQIRGCKSPHNNLIIINMDSYTKYVQIRTEALQTEVERLTKENTDLKLFILKNNLNKLG